MQITYDDTPPREGALEIDARSRDEVGRSKELCGGMGSFNGELTSFFSFTLPLLSTERAALELSCFDDNESLAFEGGKEDEFGLSFFERDFFLVCPRLLRRA